MSTHHTSDTFNTITQPGLQLQRNTGKLLATHGYVLGIEISGSGTRQSVALADLNGKILHRARHDLDIPLSTDGLRSVLDELLKELIAPERVQEGRILRVGVAVGGLVDASQGIVRTLHHAPGWSNFPLQDYLSEHLDIPCIIDNNANAAALAETLYGAGIGERVVLYVSLGRGIGGGLIVNGRIYHGVSSTAGEIGHFLVKEDGPRCSCGGDGHLEAIASAPAIINAYVSQTAGASNKDVTVERIFQKAAQNDPVAGSIVQEVLAYLGIALTNIVQLINPGMIVLGGPIAQVGEPFIAPLQKRIRELSLPTAGEQVRIVQGELGIEADIVGAVTLALQDM